jgi:hypothetical protein
MQLTTSALSFLAVLAPLAQATTLSYDQGYSQGDRSLNVVSCSDGINGLVTRYGWQKQSDIPRFPYIGGSSDIAGWNSPSCGQCYSVEYAPTGKKIFILAIDHAEQGLNVAQKAMDELTNNQAVSQHMVPLGRGIRTDILSQIQLGRIDVKTSKARWQDCALPHAKRSFEFEA